MFESGAGCMPSEERASMPLARPVTSSTRERQHLSPRPLVGVGGASPLRGDLLIRPSLRAPAQTEARGMRWCHERLVRWRHIRAAVDAWD
jgi:hypothetical protein